MKIRTRKTANSNISLSLQGEGWGEGCSVHSVSPLTSVLSPLGRGRESFSPFASLS